LQPRLLILDPFVRLHRIDENASGEVAPLLAYMRELQRRYDVAVLVVHHARKGAGNPRAGQALRGSSELHAWGDSNLYLRRDGDDLTLTVEHRAAPSLAPIAIAFAQRGPALALEVVDHPDPAAPAASGQNPLDERIAAALADIAGAMPFAELRNRCRVRTATLYERLAGSPTPAASSRPTMATASPATDSHTFDNQDKTHAQAPNSQFRFPASLQRPGTGIGKFGQAGIALPHPCPSNALHTSPSNCVITLTGSRRIVREWRGGR
jgi:hypothetical protein